MLTLARIVETDGILNVSSSEPIDNGAPLQGQLDLYSPSGEQVFSVPSKEGDPLRFHLKSVPPGLYTVQVRIGAETTTSLLLITLGDYKERLVRFHRAVDCRVSADQLDGSSRRDMLNRAMEEYAALGLTELAADVLNEVERKPPFETPARLGAISYEDAKSVPVPSWRVGRTGTGVEATRQELIQHLGTGRRKTATARVFLRPGKGEITVNGRPFENYFPSEAARAIVRQPLLATQTAERFDILISAAGGGVTGQAGAAKLGIARALLDFDLELRPTLRGLGHLTRDSRQHERKKYGQKGARKRFQFSKR